MQATSDIEVEGLTADSREVRPGWLFAALPGGRVHGLDFVPAALDRGAVAVLAPPDPRLAGLAVPLIVDDNPRRRLALMAAAFYGRQPARVVAVTGTNGKTSTAAFARQIFSLLGHASASLGTLGVLGGGEEIALQHTTPDPVALHAHLARLADRGVSHLAIEASSHGLDQYRLDGVALSAAAFTSFSRDHLDYHADAEAYLAAKLRLFAEVLPADATAVVHADMAVADRVVAVVRARGQRLLRYGTAAECELRVLARVGAVDGQDLALDVLGRRRTVRLPLAGDVQAENALAAAGLAIGAGAPVEAVLETLEHLGPVPGRLQRVAKLPNGATVFVDYCHTPDSIGRALAILRPHAAGRLVIVFGCGGDRDRGKRPEMGRAAAAGADVVVLTDDNPRTEDPAAIRRDAREGCPDAIEIGDRGLAIRHAVSLLGEGDLLLLAGKGHERGQVIGTEVRPFDDAEEARLAVAARQGAAA